MFFSIVIINMDHLAILDKNGGWLEKILSGEKSIESRWYKTRRAPYGLIKPKDIIYFKKSGMKVTAKAEVKHVLTFTQLDEKRVKFILKNYAKSICIPQVYDPKYLKYNYVILIFLKNPCKIKPFIINKKGYGMSTAWISLKNIDAIQI